MRGLALLVLFLAAVTNLPAAASDLELFKADQYLGLRQYDLALVRYRHLLGRDPANGTLNNRVGFALICLGQYSNALPRLQSALKADPTNAVFWNNLGVCRYRLKDLGGAETAWVRALEIRKDNPKVLYNLAVVSFLRRKYGKSVDLFLKAYGADRKYVSSRFDREKLSREISEMRKLYPEDRELAEIERRVEAADRRDRGKRP